LAALETRKENNFAIWTVERLTDRVQMLARSVSIFESGYVSGEETMQLAPA
jgi:hypothetical protein